MASRPPEQIVAQAAPFVQVCVRRCGKSGTIPKVGVAWSRFETDRLLPGAGILHTTYAALAMFLTGMGLQSFDALFSQLGE